MPPQELDPPMATEKDADAVIGPDLNPSRSQLDKKLYRQVLLPNGLRALLVSDVLAIHQMRNAGISNVGYDDDCEEDENKNGDDDESDHDMNEKEALDVDGDDESDDDDDGGLRNAAAAVVVGVGSMYDPPDCQGLAHFLEHLLFMGSAKYPTENAFDSFLSKHGGSDNAYTELEYTVYHLEIPQEHLFEVLDMLAQFFIHPLLLEDAVERELNSIESEFQLSKNSDECRLQQLMCHTCGYDATTHPFAKFAWGNLQSLRDIPASQDVNVMEKLRSFYNQYYYAANTRVVIVGAYSLDELQKRVVQYFADVPAEPRESAPYLATRTLAGTWSETYKSPMQLFGFPFHESSLGKIYRMIPVRDRHTLSVTWQVPPQWKNWKSKPCDFLAHLIGHEAEGSLLSLLKERSWASGCYAGVGSEGYEFSSTHALFIVTFTLSSEGVDNWEKVVAELYKYIGMLLSYGIEFPTWIHDELRAIHDLSYRFKDEESPDDFVQELAEKMVPQSLIDPEHLLDGDARLFEHDAYSVLDLLENFLKPRKCRLDLISSHFGRSSDYNDDLVEPSSLDKKVAGTSDLCTEPMFGTKYRCESVPDELLSLWDDLARPTHPDVSGLHLPDPNPFIPTTFDLKPLPPDDAHHPLLHSSLKLCISVGRKKSWFPATVTKYNSITNEILLSYEDEDAKWHKMDQNVSELYDVQPDNEGTLDDRQVKYRVIALPLEGEGAVLKFGDESDYHAQDGTGFPPLPPELPESRLPKLVVDTQELKLWHLQDRKFHRPIAELRLRFVCAEANRSPLHRTCADMFVRLCQDAVQETSYLASVCELSSSIDSSDTGFSLRVHGFDDKLLDLFSVILTVLMSFRGVKENATCLPKTIKVGRFEPLREVLERSYGNSGLKASSLCSDVRVRCLRAQQWSSQQKLLVLKDLDVATFLATTRSILDKMCVEALYHGNVSLQDAEKAKILITEALGNLGGGLPKRKYPSQLVSKLPLSVDHQTIILPGKDPQEANTAVEMYLQVGKDDIKERVIIDLLTHIMYEPFYDIVRTKSQFGYHVSCDSRFTDGVMGIHFQIVTNTKSASEATEQIDRFLTGHRSTLEEMSSEDFLEHLVGLVKQKLDMFNSLSEETDSLWGEICDGRYDWQIHRNEALCLRNVTKKDVLEAYDRWLLPGRKRRTVVVQVIGSGDSSVSRGRPDVDVSRLGQYADDLVQEFHKLTKGQTWGKIYI